MIERYKIKSNIKLTKRDYCVYCAVFDLYENGRREMTPQEIYRAMGNTNKPTRDEINQIYESIRKGLSAMVEMRLRFGAIEYKYSGSILPSEIIKGTICILEAPLFSKYIAGAFVKHGQEGGQA